MPPHFSANVYCGQTAGWIMIPLCTELGLGPGDSVLDGDPPPPRKGAQQPPIFRPMSIVAKRLDRSGYHLVQRYASAQATLLDGDPALPSTQRAQQPPLFHPLLWPTSLQAHILPITRIVDWAVRGGQLWWKSYR